jgi:hypothetical protein
MSSYDGHLGGETDEGMGGTPPGGAPIDGTPAGTTIIDTGKTHGTGRGTIAIRQSGGGKGMMKHGRAPKGGGPNGGARRTRSAGPGTGERMGGSHPDGTGEMTIIIDDGETHGPGRGMMTVRQPGGGKGMTEARQRPTGGGKGGGPHGGTSRIRRTGPGIAEAMGGGGPHGTGTIEMRGGMHTGPKGMNDGEPTRRGGVWRGRAGTSSTPNGDGGLRGTGDPLGPKGRK